MSGVKTYAVTAGASQAPSSSAVAAGGLVATAVTGGVAIVAGATVFAVMATANAAKAYMDRKERERQAILDREAEIQRKIAFFREQSRSRTQTIAIQPLDPVKTIPHTAKTASQSNVIDQDQQRQLRELQAQLPRIKADYQNLIDQGYLESQSFRKGWENIEQSASAGNLAALRSGLKTLDDARIQVMQAIQQQWEPQLDYAQERLGNLQSRLPQAVYARLQQQVTGFRQSSIHLTEQNFLDFHQQITDVELQADRALNAAEDLARAWEQAGYAVKMLPGTDDGDVEIEIQTHEGASTRMRVQYDGQQLDFFGLEEESTSCAAKTQEALRLFQEQGYRVEWSSWDGQPVPEEWRYVYSAQPETVQTASVKPNSPLRAIQAEN